MAATEQCGDRLWGIGAHQPIRVATSDPHLLQTIELSPKRFPLGRDVGLAQQLVHTVLHRQRKKSAENVAADRCV